ncbi:AraC family transcriptional regulator of adaptative response/methylated-DNA-[protein]-cysteine methyltransferase [Arcticibacter pallidicorallinus]|uniref:methylated-DNA--[protein]-cysteine S-methyltransferase n=1 Tax=Arcticibacter pallidicorallinus TaxID=1259464 RepID=A0A2T0U0P6_9SPHI|nr:methylated-DNA--[protein]-cysteine S-methyltransferase [Arcticibacter pallidicorallinus]PRY51484.1 AraC family transcriptional regulator of adaptative response/methylated-DNA-[protein]-cysteine methyltransferase [Arcticibacter pallidicorallinus]
MKTQEEINYQRIASAIEFILTNFKNQPSLDDVAEEIHLSPFHFQKLFTDWAGTTPKKFLQYISTQHAKSLLHERATLSETAFQTGLSSTSRLHDLFISIEGMTPAEYKNGGQSLHINYRFSNSPFGKVIVASTSRGVCYMAFDDDKAIALSKLSAKFPNAGFKEESDAFQTVALQIFQNDWTALDKVKLHLKASAFQLKVWEALLKIPMGALSTYGTIAKEVDSPGASRAVGTAIGRNPVAFLIPCHRVIQTSGTLGGYMWGNTRKTAIIGWEYAKILSL